ncbi:MAG TPA: DUF2007 domain-containing protein [Candidatus Deferrimicrobiaceae bacterium]
MSGSDGYEEILRTYNPIDIAMVKSLLDPERVDYFFRDEFFGYAYPWAQPARLMVRREQAFEAREILRNLILSYSVSGANVKPPDVPAHGGGQSVVRLPRAVEEGLRRDDRDAPDDPGGESGTGGGGCV